MARRISRCGRQATDDLSTLGIPTVPQQPPALSLRGHIRCAMLVDVPVRIFNRFDRPTTGRQTVWMIVSTRNFDTRQSSAATPQHTSCSVTTLTSMRG